MNCWEENYGADADGNRGEKRIFWELDNSEDEREEIIEQIYEAFTDGQIDGTATVNLHCSLLGEKVQETVSIEDYMDELIERAKCDKDFDDDKEFQDWLTIVAVEWCIKELENTYKRGKKK